MPDVRVSMIVNNKEVNVADVRLAVNRVDYFVPLDLSAYAGTVSYTHLDVYKRQELRPIESWMCPNLKIHILFTAILYFPHNLNFLSLDAIAYFQTE